MMLSVICVANLLAIYFAPMVARANEDTRSNMGPIIETYEETVVELPADDNNVAAKDRTTFNGADYARDLRNAMSGKGHMDPDKVYTVQAMLPAGELLVLATVSGCSLLSDPEDVVTGKVEPLEFSFRLADLEDCAKVTEGIISGLQNEIAAEWGNLGGYDTDGNVASSTTLQEIGVRSSRSSQKGAAGDADFHIGIQDLANAFLAANLEIKLIPTTSENVFVMHFDINGNTTAEEITKMMENIDAEKLKEVGNVIKAVSDKIINATPEEMEKMEKEFKNFLNENQEKFRKEAEDGKNVLEELSKSDISSVECTSLPLKQCDSVSKCGVVKLNGTETCMVSPKTVFWLMETNCGLQSKAGLLSIVRDFVNAGLMTDANHQTLRQSFDLTRICNAIVHTYLSADIAETEQHEAKKGFEL